MQKVVRRQCQSQKECNECSSEIPIGAYYYGNPNLCWCEQCKKKKEAEQAAAELISDMDDIENQKHNSYSVKESCKYCGGDSMDSLVRGIPCCLKQECQDKAIMETV